MEFEPHGSFDFELKGEIIIIRFYHNWNLEGAKAFFDDYKAFVTRHNLTKFGVLSDLRRIEGATPDAIDYFKEISNWAQARGQTARALLINSGLKEFVIHLIDNGKSRFPSKAFSSEAEAMAWFETLGPAVS